MDHDIKGLLKSLKMHEQTISMIMGGIVLVLILIILGNNIFNNENIINSKNGQLTQAGTDTTPEFSNQQKKYIVKSGDDLWSIAQENYNDGYQWSNIAKANNIANANIISEGTELIMPEVVTTPNAVKQESVKTSSANTLSNAVREYSVQKGDTLWSISLSHYNNGYRWSDIYNSNREVISNPDLIEVGMKLKLPQME